MSCAIPSSLKFLLELADSRRDDDQFVLLFCDAFFKGLAVLGTPRHVLSGLRRNFEIVGAVTQDAESETLSLEAILRQHDRLLGPETGGFANLFRSLIDEGDVYCGSTLEFEALDFDLKKRLAPLGRAAMQLQACDDIAIATDVSATRVSACICLANMEEWVGSGLVKSILARNALRSTALILAHRAQIEALSVQFIQSDLALIELRDFTLWYLAHHLCENKPTDPMKSRLIDTLLRRVELPNLAVFERAFSGQR